MRAGDVWVLFLPTPIWTLSLFFFFLFFFLLLLCSGSKIKSVAQSKLLPQLWERCKNLYVAWLHPPQTWTETLWDRLVAQRVGAAARRSAAGAVVWIWVELSFCVTRSDNWEISRNKLTGVLLLLLLLLLPQTHSQSHHRGAACPVRAAHSLPQLLWARFSSQSLTSTTKTGGKKTTTTTSRKYFF